MGAEGDGPARAAGRSTGLGGDLAAGFITSAVYTSLTYPIHRVKVLIQTQDANPRILSGKVARYSFTASFGRLVQEQGVAGLWRGNTPYLMRHVPSISFSFALKDAFRELLPRPDPRASPWSALASNALAGAGAGAASLALVYPFEFATVRMAADLGGAGADSQFGRGVKQVWWHAIQREGLRSTYQGFGVAVASMAAYKALYFGLYDTAKERLFGRGSGFTGLGLGMSAEGPAQVLVEAPGYVALAAAAAAGKGGGEIMGSTLAATAAADPGSGDVKQLQQQQQRLGPKQLLLLTLLAASTTFVAASITYPLDIIRKRLILEVGLDEKMYKGQLRHCITGIYQREGIRGFYRFYAYDMVFRLGGGLLLVGYDVLKGWQGAAARKV